MHKPSANNVGNTVNEPVMATGHSASNASAVGQGTRPVATTLHLESMPRGMRIGESVFDIAYLLFDLVAGIVFLCAAQGRTVFYLYAALALVLGGGDAFHLIPRVQMHLRGVGPDTQRKLGLGTAITSVTMTVFYVILYFIWRQIFPAIQVSPAIPALIFVTAALRIVLCLCPQNEWLSGRENLRWSLYRNVPFAITGILVIALFAISGNAGGYGLWRMCIAIALSFGFYLPVTFLAKRKPAVGALMLPKTLMYVWIIAMGLQLLPVL
ncbi:MAG: hypothetical protein PUD09_02470 [Coriobacteriales bacterium]|nr:hypothetical protein [Coriobacteriales bacterium]